MRTARQRLTKTAILFVAVLSLVAATAAGAGAEPPEHAQNDQAGETAPPEHAQNDEAGETAPPEHAQNEQAVETGPPDHAQNDQAGQTGPPEHAQNGDTNEAAAAERVTLCHATGSETNPFAPITVSANAVTSEGHSSHQDGRDIIPPFEGFDGQNWDADGQAIFDAGCAVDDGGQNEPDGDDGNDKVTLCHATGSETNPFVVITVSVNAVTSEGHSSHQDGRDIIPPFEGFDGQNWDAEGQAIFDADCVFDDGDDNGDNGDNGDDTTVLPGPVVPGPSQPADDETEVEGDVVVNVPLPGVTPFQPVTQPVVQPTTVDRGPAVLGQTVTRGALARTGSSSVSVLALAGMALLVFGLGLQRAGRRTMVR